MDRSFLSDKEVVAASRNYVCVRAATYENEEEVPFLTSLFQGRSPDLENTVFSLLAPDGKTQISRGGRSPQMAFRTDDTGEIIEELDSISKKYKVKNAEAPAQLPFAADARLALNVAACDNRPLLLCLANDAATLRKIEKALATHAWSEKYIGRFHYGSSSKDDLKDVVKDISIKEGIIIVQPDQFGLEATTIAAHEVGDASKTIPDTLDAALTEFDRSAPGETRSHVSKGKRAGVHWETATPITDQAANRRERPPGR